MLRRSVRCNMLVCTRILTNRNKRERRYYERNRELYRIKNDRKRAVLRDVVIRAKDVPCMDCGQRFPYYVMDFDHRGDKEVLVGRLVDSLSLRRLLAEIAKCDVVCSNCHRIRTHVRRGSVPPQRGSGPAVAESRGQLGLDL